MDEWIVHVVVLDGGEVEKWTSGLYKWWCWCITDVDFFRSEDFMYEHGFELFHFFQQTQEPRTTLPNRHIRELAFFKKDSHLSHVTQQIHHICTRTMVASVPVAIVHHTHRL